MLSCVIIIVSISPNLVFLENPSLGHTHPFLSNTAPFIEKERTHHPHPLGDSFASLHTCINETKVLPPILLVAQTDVSSTEICLDTSFWVRSNMNRMEYQFRNPNLYITHKMQMSTHFVSLLPQ